VRLRSDHGARAIIGRDGLSGAGTEETSDVTLQLTAPSEAGAFVTGMCYRLRLGKSPCEKWALTIAVKYLFKKKKGD